MAFSPLPALMAWVATVLMLMVAPILGPAAIFVNCVIPLPSAYVALRYSLPTAMVAVVATAVATVVTSGPEGLLPYLAQYGAASLLLPWLLRQGKAWDRAVALSLLLTTLLGGAGLAGYAMQRGAAILTIVEDYVASETGKALEIYRQAELPADQLELMEEVVQSVSAFLLTAWPSLILIGSAALLLTTVVLLSRFSGGYYRLNGPPFHLWKSHEMLVWPLIVAGFTLLLSGEMLQMVAINLLVLLLPLYFLQGMAIISYFFLKKGVPPLLRVLGYMTMAFFNPLPLIVTGLGLFDLWIDFRKPRLKPTS